MPSRKKTTGVASDATRRKLERPPLPSSQRPRHLIVDGYNLIHSHPELKKIIQAHGSDAARDALIKEIAILHDYEGWRMTVVFDGRGDAMGVEYPLKHRTFGCVFSPTGISADEVIQGLVEKFSNRDDLVVATGDGGIRIFIQTNGARWLPDDELWRWVREASDSLGRALKRK
jgi:predicted RNA-binding protein with PIN domain